MNNIRDTISETISIGMDDKIRPKCNVLSLTKLKTLHEIGDLTYDIWSNARKTLPRYIHKIR